LISFRENVRDGGISRNIYRGLYRLDQKLSCL